MTSTADNHLARLAHADALERLSAMELGWSPTDSSVCATLRFKRAVQQPPPIVGLLGGASSGKSTLFNSLAGAEISAISAHAHETLGPIGTVTAAGVDAVVDWSRNGLWLPGYNLVPHDDHAPTRGEPAALVLHGHHRDDLGAAIVLDLPDVTSKLSADEGSITHGLLPWLDGVVAVVDEERWFDAAVFEYTLRLARQFGPKLWIVFNRTERPEPLAAEWAQQLRELAARLGANATCVCPFAPGAGYRSVADDARAQVASWLTAVGSPKRSAMLESYLQRRCADLLRENVSRADKFRRMERAVDDLLSKTADDARLSIDLLTSEERRLLGVGHRYLPLYDMMITIKDRLRWLGGTSPPATARRIDFEKREDAIALVLRENLQRRFGHAADRIDELVADSEYLPTTLENWHGAWSAPPFDERGWASRVRAHIDAWKSETSRQGRRGDLAALSLGTPLLLADLLFLGGAGVTMTWAAVWIAGFLGGKGVVRALNGSPAYSDYQTTVRAYQTFIREALGEQWRQNVTALPKRHLPMSDPLLESVMYWSSPRKH